MCHTIYAHHAHIHIFAQKFKVPTGSNSFYQVEIFSQSILGHTGSLKQTEKYEEDHEHVSPSKFS